MRLLFLILLIGSNVMNAQLSKKHWIPPIHARNGQTFVRDHYVYLSTPETTPFQVTVTRGDNTPIAGSPFTISAGNPVRVAIGNNQPSTMLISNNDLNIVKNDKGLILEGSNEFYATFKVRAENHAEILVAKGYQGLGTEFRLGSLPQSDYGDLRNFFASFMATEDNTTVTLSDYDRSVEFAVNGTTLTQNSQTFRLNNGESVTVSGYTNTSANLTGFIGALLVSDKPIAVNSGNALAGMGTEQDGQDFTFDQIVPLEQVGTEYIVVKGNGSSLVETPLVIATEDNTEVFINGSPTSFATLNAGEYTLIPSTMYQGTNNQNMYITSSKPIYLYQILGGSSSDATSGLNFIPPLSCYFQKSVDLIPSANSIGSTNYFSEIIALTYAGSTLSINGVPVTALPEPVLGTSQWVTYRLQGYTGNIKAESTGPLAVGLFGSSNVAGFAGYYSGFGSEPRDTEITVCSNTTTDLFGQIEGNPDPGGVWTPALSSGTGVFDPAIDPPGIYNYNFTGLCEIVNLQITVTIQQAPNPGNNNQKTVCKNDAAFDLFALLGPNANTGGTWSPALASGTNIFNPAVDVSGNYTYTLPAIGPCTSVSATVAVTVNPLPVINTILDYELCDDTTDGSDINGTANFNFSTKTNEVLAGQTGIIVTYHLSQNDADTGSNPQTILNTNSRIIYVRLQNATTNCFVTTTFNAVVHSLPVINNNITLKQCDDNQDAITAFNLTEANSLISTDPDVVFSYFTSSANALANTNPITDFTNFISAGTTIWIRVQNTNGCFRIATTTLLVSATQITAADMQTLEECDMYIDPNDPENDGYAYFDFTPATTGILNSFTSSQNLRVTYYENLNDALAEQNAVMGTNSAPYRNTVASSQTLYVRVDSNLNNECVGMGPYLNLTVNPIPDIDLGDDFTLCLDPATGLGSQNIDATPSNTGNFSYTWTPANPDTDANGNQNAVYHITQAGTYTVVVTNTNTSCETSDTITIDASSEPLTVTAVLITPLFSNGLATIQATAQGGYGVYEYSIDGTYWQPTGIFSGLSNGAYLIFVRDLAKCGVTTSNLVHTVTYPSFFTPNGDGYNDTWKIDNLLASYEAKIYIFDRFGKLVKEISPDGKGWDGTFNGNQLPATDYWFKIEYTVNNVRNEFKSHFSLKR
ncbi:T9SS type B sorting domain-containing protein [Flavobacterium saliperosum]|uniref:Gliding motility-associated C-terminal domain-containing protein n=2 Tax=Flavobacterium saliperosum TaxID=329186 RepID=A0A1G4VA31_9FLAO|nr:T9SS type B sorting domain-containing protein [Flavobacterium saliperosum]SCX03522.1 gliding motility-associated C-terminal domain-containing protein [Flavobacterium saliperosum]